MAFRRKKKITTTYSDPEALFRDQRNRRVEGPLSHQSDMLRKYMKEALEKHDVALELPTGSGKTLVGLLIAEFRRVTRRERVLYLCPTKQLALQVCEQADRKYGLKATPFIGSIKNYDPDDRVAYQTGRSIAVATYSALFNTNPFFTTPNLIILDDAHACENYIAASWSLDIGRTEYPEIYLGLLTLLKDTLPPSQFQRFNEDDRDERGKTWIETVPVHSIAEYAETIHPFLDEHTSNNNLQYPWSLLHGHLNACHIYVSYDNFLIRPYIPPTLTHAPFADATQRIYMSATLGLGGDLERMTGVKSIHRLPIPPGWDKQGIGRRFFIFPGLSLSEDEVPHTVKRMADAAGRALVLVPSNNRAKKYKTLFDDRTVFSASDIEASKDDFVNDSKAVSVLANRYDGIDLLGDECRLLIIEGLPKAGNLQELFFMSRMASSILLNDRIRTRIIQAVGRCTRSATDYAAVCIIGDDFSDWLVLNQKRSLFHPEMQGELKFGVEQSEQRTADELIENFKIFLEHDVEWDEIDAEVREYRDESSQSDIPGQRLLFESCSKEVDYQYALWNYDHERCADIAQSISSILSGNDLMGLRGFWHYAGAANCELASRQLDRPDLVAKAADLYSRAAACLPALSWIRIQSSRLIPSTAAPKDAPDEFLESNIERIEAEFDKRSYATPRRFERDAMQIIRGLDSNDDSEAFEEAHRQLGELLGFDAGNSKGHSAPDPWWISGNRLCLVSEDKNDSKSDNPVPVKHARQAASHQLWIADNITLGEGAEVHTVMITPATKVHKNVPTYSGDVAWWHIDDFRKWARQAIATLRNLRASFTGLGNVAWRDQVRQTLVAQKIDPKSIITRATRTALSDVPTE